MLHSNPSIVESCLRRHLLLWRVLAAELYMLLGSPEPMFVFDLSAMHTCHNRCLWALLQMYLDVRYVFVAVLALLDAFLGLALCKMSVVLVSRNVLIAELAFDQPLGTSAFVLLHVLDVLQAPPALLRHGFVLDLAVVAHMPTHVLHSHPFVTMTAGLFRLAFFSVILEELVLSYLFLAVIANGVTWSYGRSPKYIRLGARCLPKLRCCNR